MLYYIFNTTYMKFDGFILKKISGENYRLKPLLRSN